MEEHELQAVNAEVRAVADRIQPLLHAHPGLAKRNAHAHVWLGLKVVFGEDWRERTSGSSARAFLAWMELNPNADYGEYQGPKEELSAEQRGTLF